MLPTSTDLLVFGVSGYPGALVSGTLEERDVPHVAASRDQAHTEARAEALGLESRTFELSERENCLTEAAHRRG